MSTRRMILFPRISSSIAAFLVAFAVTAGLRYSGATVRALQPPTADPLPLIQQQDLQYLGAFRPPEKPANVSNYDSFAYSGSPIAYWPAHDSLVMVGFPAVPSTNEIKTGEISIPEIRIRATVPELARASLLQPMTDLLGGKRKTVDGDTSNGVYIGGVLPFANSLIVSAWDYYDGNGLQSTSHFRTGTDFGNLGQIVGPVALQSSLRTPAAGFVSGYMAPIPPDWQAALGATAVTGNCCISIVSRTSFGPSISAFNPTDIGAVNPVPTKPLIGYPQTHPTVGNYGPEGATTFYNGKMDMGGVIFPGGTSSVLFWGRRGTSFCYGTGTNDPALHMQPVPAYPTTHYCYDPVDSGKGSHGYPYESFVAAYDANELVKVKNGQKQPWEVVPYGIWVMSLPFSGATRYMSGVTYDPATRRIFVSAPFADGVYPVVHVFQLNVGSTGGTGNRLCYN